MPDIHSMDATSAEDAAAFRPLHPIRALPRRFFRRTGGILCGLILIGAIALAVDFARFASGLQGRGSIGRADGIVVLTGGAERIPQAVDLLADGLGQRLLITGVNRATSEDALSARAPGTARLLDCCIDVDRNALNTVGNAMEAARWVHEKHFASIIVVTSIYHMPRSMMEMRRVLPDTELLAYPVVPRDLKLDRWWEDPTTMRLLLSEYVKYSVATLWLRFEKPTAEDVQVASRAF